MVYVSVCASAEPPLVTVAWCRLYSLLRTAIISRARGAYWVGRAAAAAGQQETAKQWYEAAAAMGDITFYGQAAAIERYGSGVQINPPQVQPISAQSRANFSRNSLVIAATILQQQGDKDGVRSFMFALANGAKTQDEAILTLDLASRFNRADIAAMAAKKLGGLGFRIPAEGYPVLRTQNLPAAPENALIHAIIRQESTFDAQARSPAGALGYMQLMPETAARQAQSLGIKGHSTALLSSNPMHNIRLGSAYLEAQMQRFNRNPILAAAAYNAGPARVSQWLDRYGTPNNPTLPTVRTADMPALWHQIDWAEAIPFNETRNYVMRVNEALSVYRTLLQQKPAAIALLVPHM